MNEHVTATHIEKYMQSITDMFEVIHATLGNRALNLETKGGSFTVTKFNQVNVSHSIEQLSININGKEVIIITYYKNLKTFEFRSIKFGSDGPEDNPDPTVEDIAILLLLAYGELAKV